MISRLEGAPSLPIKDEVDLAIEARTREILRDYDVTPEVAAQMARADVMKNMDQSGAPTPAGALARQHQDAGASPDRARKLAENQVQTYGPQGAWGLYREYETPEGMTRLMEAQAENNAADVRHQKMYDDYFTATNAPSHQRVTPETQRQWDDTGRYVAESRRIREAGLHPNTPVDPIDPSARYKSDEEADRKKEARDARMEGVFKNIRQRYGEEEEAAARDAYSRGEIHVPQTSAQRSRNEYRKNLEYTAMGDGDNADESRQRLRAMEAGVNYDDLTPNEAAALRARGGNMSAEREDRMMRRLRNQARLTGQTDNAAYNDAGMLRELIAGNREAKREQNETMWRARAMLRGGNAVGAQALPGLNDWQRQMLSGGPTPLGVQAAQAAGAGRAADADVRLAALQAQMEEAEATRQQQAQQFQERMQAEADKRETDRQLAAEQHQLAAERLTADNKRGLAEIDARLLASKMEMDAKLGATNAAVAEKEKERLAAEAAAVRARQMAWQQQEPGLFDIASGRANTRSASAALKALAATSDRFQWLPGGGFGLREATAMNEELLRIAAQAQQLGVQSPLADPEYRRKLIMQYGYSSGWSGGRGGWFGDFWQPMPEGLE